MTMVGVPHTDLVPFTEIIPPDNGSPILPPDLRRSLSDMFQTVWRWRRRFFIVFGSVLCLGVLALSVMPIKYTAQALVMVGSHEPNPLVNEPTGGSQQRELDVDGAIQVMVSPLSLRRVTEKLNLVNRPEFEKTAQNAKPSILVRLRGLIGRAPDEDYRPDPASVVDMEIQRHLTADRLGRSAFVMITYTASSPKVATDIANAVANNTAADDAFQAGLTVTERAGFDLLRVWVVSPATVPIMPSSPNFLIVLAVAVAGGLCMALSAVLFADYYATRKVISAGQMARRGLRTLGFIPMFSGQENRTAVRIVSERPNEAFSDSIASLRASLLRLVPQEPPTCLVLMFTSALPFEGKSTTVAALAASIAGSGGRVLLIDADLRAPTLHRIFGASSAPGLSNVLDDDVVSRLDRLIQMDPHSGVHLLAAGPHHPRPLDILCSKQLARTIEGWRNSFDFILIDVPPLLATSDALVVVPIVDYCVFVVRWGKTGWETINHGLRLLTEVGARIAGVAVSRVDPRQFAPSGFPSAIYSRYTGAGSREA